MVVQKNRALEAQKVAKVVKNFAVGTGEYVGTDDAFTIAKEADNKDWTQVGYDPIKRGFFSDRKTERSNTRSR